MKYDSLGCIVREKYEPGHPANLGDSCAETCRAYLLGDENGALTRFYFPFFIKFYRHPDLKDTIGWDAADFSNDQMLPFLMALNLKFRMTIPFSLTIPGTKTIVSIGVLALMLKQYWLLNVANIIQGWLFNLKWRVGDGFKIERSDGQVQDWLNYICTYVFLKRIGHWATLNQSRDRCMKAVRKYYLEGPDWEPNSQWIVDMYEQALKPETQTDGSLR